MAVGRFSPITQRSASSRLDLPQPFGPTTPVSPSAITRSVGSTKLLNPFRRRRVKRITTALAILAPKRGRTVPQDDGGCGPESTPTYHLLRQTGGYPPHLAASSAAFWPLLAPDTEIRRPPRSQRPRENASLCRLPPPGCRKAHLTRQSVNHRMVAHGSPSHGCKAPLGIKRECGAGRSPGCEALFHSRPRDCQRRAVVIQATGQPGRQTTRSDPQARRPAMHGTRQRGVRPFCYGRGVPWG
jgi:hypothetical protein